MTTAKTLAIAAIFVGVPSLALAQSVVIVPSPYYGGYAALLRWIRPALLRRVFLRPTILRRILLRSAVLWILCPRVLWVCARLQVPRLAARLLNGSQASSPRVDDFAESVRNRSARQSGNVGARGEGSAVVVELP